MADRIEMPAGACLEAGLIAAYVDGRLTGGEKARVTAHLSDCEECYFVFAESVRLRPRQAPAPWPQRAWCSLASAPAWGKGVGSIVGLAAAASLWFVLRPAVAPSWWPGRSPMADLVAAVGTERTFEPRLTGGFAYGPIAERAATRSARGLDAQSADVRMAALKLEQWLRTQKTATSLGAFGAAELVIGRPETSVALLEEAVRLQPDSPRLRSDLAAAYLVRFSQTKAAADADRALAAAIAASQRDRSLPEAQFNRALALEALSRLEDALRAWQTYLQLDSSSAWAQEATRHLAENDAAILRAQRRHATMER
jgi:hypothetical protein